jgi:anti-sigma factor RsiW
MIAKSQTATGRRKTMPAGPAGHAHSRAHCIKVLRQLSDYLDNDLSTGICKEIRKHLALCPNCEIFVDSLRQTINLCRRAASPRLSPALKARIRSQILRAIGHS